MQWSGACPPLPQMSSSEHRWNNHPTIDKLTAIEKEPRDLHRKVLKAVYIKVRGATLNCNDGYCMQKVYLPLLREDIHGQEACH